MRSIEVDLFGVYVLLGFWAGSVMLCIALGKMMISRAEGTSKNSKH